MRFEDDFRFGTYIALSLYMHLIVFLAICKGHDVFQYNNHTIYMFQHKENVNVYTTVSFDAYSLLLALLWPDKHYF